MRLLFLLSILCLNCNTNDTIKKKSAFFGGEIINPKTDFVTLITPNNIQNNLKLENNRFGIHINPIEKGLYVFIHHNEYQTVLLEPNDSIVLRVNTLEFDESLFFNGRGAKKNNFLTSLFLDFETINKYPITHLKPIRYHRFIDSFNSVKKNKLKKFRTSNKTSKLFNQAAKATINYNYYAYKEEYPLNYFGNAFIEKHKSLPKDFYSFRNHINYNDTLFAYYPSYSLFLINHFNNLSLSKNQSNIQHYNTKYSKKITLSKFDLIDSLISVNSIKNPLFVNCISNFMFFNRSNVESMQVVLESFLKKCTNEEDKTDITDKIESLKLLVKGKVLPSTSLNDYHGKSLSIDAIITKPTLFYFWFVDEKINYEKIKSLKQNHPNLNFAVIAVDVNTDDLWKKKLKNLGVPKENIFRFNNSKNAYKVYALSLTQIILVDSNQKILSSSLNLYSTNFEKELDTLLN